MDAKNTVHNYETLVEAGNAALGAAEWSTARERFQRALSITETPEALEGLGMAAWWLDDGAVLFKSRERAYALYRERCDSHGSARIAVWLALDYYIFQHAPAVANGWLQRAQHFLDEIDRPSFEHCFMAFSSGHIALEEHDIASTRAHAEEAVALARQLGIIDFEMLSLALQGLALVSEGNVDDGMRCLGEAITAALAGELSDPDAIVTSCCYLLFACERVRDYERASQWCDKLKELCQRWSYRSMFAVCRAHYAAVLMWRGDWTQAEIELVEATDELLAGRAGWAAEGLIHLGELRRRQGRPDEAAKLFEQAMGHPHSLLGKAELALDQGDNVSAIDLVDRFLRRIPPEEITARFGGLETSLRASIASGDLSRAQAALVELESAAELVGTDPLRAAVFFGRGLVAASHGELDQARRCFEDAVDLYLRVGAPFETARARLELARALHQTGRHLVAVAEAREALISLEKIGARGEALRAASLVREIASTESPDVAGHLPYPGLTPRETEILNLVAGGLTNPEIAEKLFLSIRTVERHISSIYQKIGAEGKAARAVATAFALEHGPLSVPES